MANVLEAVKRVNNGLVHSVKKATLRSDAETATPLTEDIIIPTGGATPPTIGVDEEPYTGQGHSYQVLQPDLNLDAAAGSNDPAQPKFLAALMGNIIGNALT